MAPEQDSVGIAEQLRALEVQLPKQHAEGSTARSETNVSVGRSLSTMKREQTRVVQNQAGYSSGVVDSLVHGDSGLRLTAGRMVDELPPTYVAE
jgi:hypothetical protein